MTQPTRDQLFDYLFDALDEAERGHIETALAENSQVRAELQQLRGCLAPFQADQPHPAPVGLAERTQRYVARHVEDNAPRLSPPVEEGRAPSGQAWTAADLLVALGICLAAALLFFPAMATSRYQAQLAVCQNNLRQVGLGLMQFSQRNGDYFPAVPESGKRAVAGVYAATLVDKGYIDNADCFFCPSHVVAEGAQTKIPTLAEIDRAEGEVLARLHHIVGGSFAYNMGYVEGELHHAIRNLGRNNYPLLADAPNPQNRGLASSHHDARGQNVLYENGRVAYVVGCKRPDCGDQIFLSDRNLVEAGRSANDAVLGDSSANPLP